MEKEKMKFITADNLKRFGTNVKKLVTDTKSGLETKISTAQSAANTAKQAAATAQGAATDAKNNPNVKTINGKSIIGSGNLTLSDIGIDGNIVEIVTSLPDLATAKSNKMYLVPVENSSEANNTYAEYVKINKDNKDSWEKLGEWKAEIDLTPYSKKVDTVNGVTAGANDASKITLNVNKNGANTPVNIPAATTTIAGAMSAADKSVLNKIAAKYPFNISGISANPSVVEIGTSAQPTINWSFANEEFHPVNSQNLKSDNGYISLTGENVTVGNKSYKAKNAYSIPQGSRNQNDKVTLTVTTTDGATKTASVTIAHVHANYCGVVAADKTSLTAAEVIALASQTNGKAIINSRSRTVAVTQNNQKLVYAYPAYFGDLTSIKDGNGFQGFSGYTKKTVDVNGATYNVYIQNTAATANGTYTFA